jgi:tRNA pseudouridine55 synthase
MATGLLVVLLGAYARLAPYLTAATKSYEATISFGDETDTDDAQGTTVRTEPVPAEVLEPRYARSVLSGFLGTSSQLPPSYSAIKVGGQTAHRAARAGAPLTLEPREIRVTRAELVSIDPPTRSWRVDFTVSKGTYVRALARDIGRACGTAAHLSALRRTGSGPLTLADARSLDEVLSACSDGRTASLFADPLTALALPVTESPDTAALTGAAFDIPDDMHLLDGQPVSVTHRGALAAVYRVSGGRLLPAVVLPRGAVS